MFTGDEFADGGEVIREVLKKENIRGSFFLTGNFYSNRSFKRLVRGLKKDGHYLGAHSDAHLLYADWTKRDSLLVTKEQFKRDLDLNYDKLKAYGVKKSQAPYFLPPYEWYNQAIAAWTKEMGLELVNFSPGTRTTADYTYPEMGASYRSSDEIYKSVFSRESSDPDALNGFIMLVHIGTDPRRTDKFYMRLQELIDELQAKGYTFVDLETLFAG